MSEENKTHKIELIGGYTDKDGKVHREVEFGKRITAKDLMNLDSDPQAQNPTQYADLVRRKMLTKFGSLKMPVPLNALLALDSLDREDLDAAAEKFLQMSRNDRTAEIRDNGEVKLRFGFDIDGTFYDVVEFGKLTTGKDAVDADALGQGVARQCFMFGRQITKISTSDGTASIDGAVDVEKFYALDAEDFNQIRVGVALWQTSFRLKRESLSQQRNGGNSLHSGAGNENDGNGDSDDAGDAD